MSRFHRAVFGLAVVVASIAAACAPAAPSPSTPASKATSRSPALQALVDAANKEGRVHYADTGSPETLAELNKRFNQRFGTDIAVELVPLRAIETNTRVRQEAAAGKVTLDVVHPSTGIVFSLLEDNVPVFEPFDWVGMFGDVLPEIKDVAERVPDVARGLALEYQHLIRAILYNKNLVSAQDLPRTWEDLLDPRWRGKKIAIDPQGSSTYQHMVRWDDAKVLDYSRKLAAQDPLWIGSTVNIVRAVARGEALLGISSINSILDLQRAGEPLEIAPTEFYPATQQLIFPVKGSPNVNAARLWTAWYATEGAAIASELGEISDRGWPDSNSHSSRKLAELKGELAMLITPEDLERAERLRVQIADEYKRLGAR